MAFSDRQLFDALRMASIDSAELAGIMDEPNATVHRWLSDLWQTASLGGASHITAHLPLSGKYCLTAKGIRQAGDVGQTGISR